MIVIRLGVQGRDKVTGFAGIVVGRAEYLYGCLQYAIAPPVGADGKIGDTHWFDEGRVEVTGQGVKPEDVRVERNGGPSRDAPRI